MYYFFLFHFGFGSANQTYCRSARTRILDTDEQQGRTRHVKIGRTGTELSGKRVSGALIAILSIGHWSDRNRIIGPTLMNRLPLSSTSNISLTNTKITESHNQGWTGLYPARYLDCLYSVSDRIFGRLLNLKLSMILKQYDNKILIIKIV